MITEEDLIAWGFEPGPKFPEMLKTAQIMEECGMTEEAIRSVLSFPENFK